MPLSVESGYVVPMNRVPLKWAVLMLCRSVSLPFCNVTVKVIGAGSWTEPTSNLNWFSLSATMPPKSGMTHASTHMLLLYLPESIENVVSFVEPPRKSRASCCELRFFLPMSENGPEGTTMLSLTPSKKKALFVLAMTVIVLTT